MILDVVREKDYIEFMGDDDDNDNNINNADIETGEQQDELITNFIDLVLSLYEKTETPPAPETVKEYFAEIEPFTGINENDAMARIADAMVDHGVPGWERCSSCSG